MFLLEAWAVDRAQQVTPNELALELARHWDTTDERAVAYLLGLEPQPLAEYRTLTDRVAADGRELVQAIVARAFTDENIHARREAVMEAMHVSGIEHLRALAVDITSTAIMSSRIHQFGQAAHNSGRHEVAIAAAGARMLVDDCREAAAAVLRNLSIYEIARIALDADRHFQTACLEVFSARDRVDMVHDRPGSTRGTFGPLPWWRITVDDETRVQAEAVIQRQSGMLGLRHDEGSDLLSLHLYDHDGEYFHTFSYDLRVVADVFQLVLLGRTERLGIDFAAGVSGKPVELGTFAAPLPIELSEHLRDAASAALREHLGLDSGYQPYDAVLFAAQSALATPSTRSIWSRRAP